MVGEAAAQHQQELEGRALCMWLQHLKEAELQPPGRAAAGGAGGDGQAVSGAAAL